MFKEKKYCSKERGGKKNTIRRVLHLLFQKVLMEMNNFT